MTEQQWMESADPTPMLDALRGKASDRKLRLFACACCRRIWPLITHGPSREAVEASERYADRAARSKELVKARNVAMLPAAESDQAQYAALAAARPQVAAGWVALVAQHAVAGEVIVGPASAGNLAAHADPRTLVDEQESQAALARDVFGNPFRPVQVDPSWLHWHDGTVVRIAQAIYDECRFQDLPILADALEEAGCTDEAILTHCRGPEEHVRGCWVVDLILGKK